MSASGAGWAAGGLGSGSLVLGAGTAAGRIDRSGERTDPVPGGVRPVAPAEPAGERSGRRAEDQRASGDSEAGHPEAVRPEAGRPKSGRLESVTVGAGGADAGSLDAARLDAGRRDAGRWGEPDLALDRAGVGRVAGRGLVPVGAAQPPTPTPTRREVLLDDRLPVASAPQLPAPIGAATASALKIAVASDPAIPAPRGWGAGIWSSGIWDIGGAADGAIQPRAMADVGGTSGRPRGRGAPPAAAVSDSYRRRGGMPPVGVASGRIFRVSV